MSDWPGIRIAGKQLAGGKSTWWQFHGIESTRGAINGRSLRRGTQPPSAHFAVRSDS